MPNTSVSLSTTGVPGPSAVAVLNWRGGRPVLCQITTSSSVAVGDFTVQWTANDIQLTGLSSEYPLTGVSSVAIWSGLSSSPYVNSIGAQAIHWTSSTIWPDGVSYQFVAPPAALRLYSTGLSSNTLTLTAIEGDGA